MAANGARFRPRKIDPVSGPDEQRRLGLSRNRTLATGLLAVMGECMLAPTSSRRRLGCSSHERERNGACRGTGRLVRGHCTFPAPPWVSNSSHCHRAHQQERIAQALSRFVEQNFLTRELLIRKVRQLEVGKRAAHWLASPQRHRLSPTGWL